MNTLKAARFHAPFDVRIEEVDYPIPAEDEVVLKVIRASICNGSDGALYSGRRKREIAYPWMKLPWPQGHECAGEIVEVGKAVGDFKIGDHVACLKYGGAFAEYQCSNVDQLVPMPAGMPYDHATFIEPLYCTYAYTGHVREGDAVVVCGLGPSGNLLLQESGAVGAQKVCAVDMHSLRLEKAKDAGADVCINASAGDPETEIREMFGPADVFIDATGFDVYDLAVRVLRPEGRLVMYGVADSGVRYDGTRAFFKKIRFCTDYKTDKKATTFEAMRYVETGAIRLDVFTTHHFSLDQVPQALQLVVEHPDQIVGAVIDVG
ncbi:MAG: zinc-binding dehydrogenase [Armatimonadetes bacterium]|nr:zinc-binding dehydrogenase [Armatimonadota bacterium]